MDNHHATKIYIIQHTKLTVIFVMEVGSGNIVGTRVSGTVSLLLSLNMIFSVIKAFLDTNVSFRYTAKMILVKYRCTILCVHTLA